MCPHRAESGVLSRKKTAPFDGCIVYCVMYQYCLSGGRFCDAVYEAGVYVVCIRTVCLVSDSEEGQEVVGAFRVKVKRFVIMSGVCGGILARFGVFFRRDISCLLCCEP